MAKQRSYRLLRGTAAEGFQCSRAKVQLMAGGFANGKTTALCIKAIMVARDYPGSNMLLARSTYPKLNDTLRKEFIKWCPQAYIKRNLTSKENMVELINGSVINFRYVAQQGTKNEASTSNLLSANFDFIGVDQIEDPEITHKDFLDLLGRLRGSAEYAGADTTMPSSGPRWFCITANPTRNWVYHRLVKPLDLYNRTGKITPDLLIDKSTGEVLIDIFNGSTYENAENIPADYLATLESTYDGVMKERFVEGKWGGYDGLIYPEFDDLEHGLEASELEQILWDTRASGFEPQWYEAYDHGLSEPSCYMLAFTDKLGRIFIVDGFYKREQPYDVSADRIKAIRERWGCPGTSIFADPAVFNRHTSGKGGVVGERVADLFAEADIMMQRGNNDIGNGIVKVQQLLRLRQFQPHPITNNGSSPSLFINRDLEWFGDEIGNYHWLKDKSGEHLDVPSDKDNHAMDTVRYLITDRPAPAGMAPVVKRKWLKTSRAWTEQELPDNYIGGNTSLGRYARV